MNFELLVVPDCPHQDTAAQLFRSCLDALGIDANPTVRVVADTDTAVRLGFTGSPSFFCDGHDVLPQHSAPAIACRLYHTSKGASPTPDQHTLTDAIKVASTL